MNGVIGPPHIALSLAGLDRGKDMPWGADARSAIEWTATIGARAVVLDATMSGVRARELDRSGRRDLASLLRRMGLGFAGIDAWIPPSHYTDATNIDRALDAVEGAIGLCAELSDLSGAQGRVLSLALPEPVSAAVTQRIAADAEQAGVVVADHGVPRGGESARHAPIIGQGVDPAALLAAGQDPVAFVAGLKLPPAVARLTDMGGAGRIVAGGRGGRMSLQGYLAALHIAGYRTPLVADVRHMTDQAAAAVNAIRVGSSVT